MVCSCVATQSFVGRYADTCCCTSVVLFFVIRCGCCGVDHIMVRKVQICGRKIVSEIIDPNARSRDFGGGIGFGTTH